jgi:hypothetical protein
MTSRAHMQKGENQQLDEKLWGVNRGRTRPRRVSPSRSAQPFLWQFGLPFDLDAPQVINSSYHEGLPHPFIREPQIKGDMPKEAAGRRKTSSYLEDGLGHALATIVGPAW